MISDRDFTTTLESDVKTIVARVAAQFDALPEAEQSRETFRELIYDAVSDAVYANDWFARASHGAATYGVIIEELSDSPRTDPSEVDIPAAGDQPTPTAALRTLSRELYELELTARVIESADWPTDTDEDTNTSAVA